MVVPNESLSLSKWDHRKCSTNYSSWQENVRTKRRLLYMSRQVFERGPAGAGVALGLGGGADLELCDRVDLPVSAADRVFVADVPGVEHRPAGDADVRFLLCHLF